MSYFERKTLVICACVITSGYVTNAAPHLAPIPAVLGVLNMIALMWAVWAS